MTTRYELNIRDVPFQPNHISFKVTGDPNNPDVSLEVNPNTVPNTKAVLHLTRTQLIGINEIVNKFLKDGQS